MSLGAMTPHVERPPVSLHQDAAFRRFERLLNAKMYPRSRAMVCSGCNRYWVTATVTGRVDAAGPHQGFGHLNAYGARFVLENVADVAAKDRASEYDSSEFSTTPVRFPTGYLSGRVLAPNGKSVVGVEVDVASTEDVPPYMHDFTEWTDGNGRFEVAVPPGRYLLGINTQTPPSARFPFPATFYPSAVSVADRQHIRGLHIRAPRTLTPRTIGVRVVWPDGKPVEGANVWLTEVRNPIPVVGTSVSHTNADGVFDLIGFTGIDYVIHANVYLKSYYTPHCAEKRTLKSDDPLDGPITMVLAREGETCRGDD